MELRSLACKMFYLFCIHRAMSNLVSALLFKSTDVMATVRRLKPIIVSLSVCSFPSGYACVRRPESLCFTKEIPGIYKFAVSSLPQGQYLGFGTVWTFYAHRLAVVWWLMVIVSIGDFAYSLLNGVRSPSGNIGATPMFMSTLVSWDGWPSSITRFTLFDENRCLSMPHCSCAV